MPKQTGAGRGRPRPAGGSTDGKVIRQLARVFRALADEHRLRDPVAVAANGEMSVSAYWGGTRPVAAGGQPPLDEAPGSAGLIDFRRDGKFNYYRVDDAGMAPCSTGSSRTAGPALAVAAAGDRGEEEVSTTQSPPVAATGGGGSAYFRFVGSSTATGSGVAGRAGGGREPVREPEPQDHRDQPGEEPPAVPGLPPVQSGANSARGSPGNAHPSAPRIVHHAASPPAMREDDRHRERRRPRRRHRVHRPVQGLVVVPVRRSPSPSRPPSSAPRVGAVRTRAAAAGPGPGVPSSRTTITSRNRSAISSSCDAPAPAAKTGPEQHDQQ